jgi:hypothetical protein
MSLVSVQTPHEVGVPSWREPRLVGDTALAVRFGGGLLPWAVAHENCLDSALNTSHHGFGAASAQPLGIVTAAKCSNLMKLQIPQQASVEALAQAMNIKRSLISLLSRVLGSDKLAR